MSRASHVSREKIRESLVVRLSCHHGELISLMQLHQSTSGLLTCPALHVDAPSCLPSEKNNITPLTLSDLDNPAVRLRVTLSIGCAAYRSKVIRSVLTLVSASPIVVIAYPKHSQTGHR